MSNKKVCPPSLPVELWVEILSHNTLDPVQLKNLAEIRKGKKGQDGFITSMLRSKSLARKNSPAIKTQINNAFLGALASAAKHNSLMRHHASGLNPKENLLRAYFQKIELKKIDHQRHIERIHQANKVLPSMPSFPDLNEFDASLSYLIFSQHTY